MYTYIYIYIHIYIYIYIYYTHTYTGISAGTLAERGEESFLERGVREYHEVGKARGRGPGPPSSKRVEHKLHTIGLICCRPDLDVHGVAVADGAAAARRLAE